MIQEYKDKLNRLKGKQESLQLTLSEWESKLKIAQDDTINIELAQALIQETAQETQSQLKYCLEDIVNSLLNACFPGYEVAVEFDVSGGRTEANIVLYKEGYEIKPKGGIADIISLGFRIAVWSIGNSRNVLCLDESLKWLSADLQPMAGEILHEISHKLGINIIMPSHIEPLLDMADKVYRVKIVDGVSKVT